MIRSARASGAARYMAMDIEKGHFPAAVFCFMELTINAQSCCGGRQVCSRNGKKYRRTLKPIQVLSLSGCPCLFVP